MPKAPAASPEILNVNTMNVLTGPPATARIEDLRTSVQTNTLKELGEVQKSSLLVGLQVRVRTRRLASPSTGHTHTRAPGQSTRNMGVHRGSVREAPSPEHQRRRLRQAADNKPHNTRKKLNICMSMARQSTMLMPPWLSTNLP